jgi:hypothetical protein
MIPERLKPVFNERKFTVHYNYCMQLPVKTQQDSLTGKLMDVVIIGRMD